MDNQQMETVVRDEPHGDTVAGGGTAKPSKGAKATKAKTVLRLPAVSFKSVHGFLHRAGGHAQSAAHALIRNAVQLSSSSSTLDVFSVSLDVVEHEQELLAALVELSWGGLLEECPAQAVLHDAWGETRWLQRMGFYSLECWIANRLELLLWRGWREAHTRAKPVPAPTPHPAASMRGLVCKSLAGAIREQCAASAPAALGERTPDATWGTAAS